MGEIMRKDLTTIRRWLCFALAVLGPWEVCLGETPKVSTRNESQAGLTQSLTFAETSEYFDGIYRDFYQNYKLGPGDEVAVRVVGQPDFSQEHLKVSPTGRLYHPLIGDIPVARLTVEQLTAKLTSEFSEYIQKPVVSVELLAAQSAKIGVLGDVGRPGIIVMTEPTTVLGAITASGGVTDNGKKSEITLLRQNNEGGLRIVTVNLKRILEGKADPEQNLTLKAGDTLIVHGNLRKKINTVMAPLWNFTNFLYLASLVNE
jgi:protein involved in polysaccharide export with SLBB domain